MYLVFSIHTSCGHLYGEIELDNTTPFVKYLLSMHLCIK